MCGTRTHNSLLVIAAIIALLFASPEAGAGDATPSLHDFKLTNWTIDDGAPPGIRALAQTDDGFLWVGALTGLFRFDGLSFERMPGINLDESGDQAVTALMPARNGDLWIGFNSGAIGVLHEGRLLDRTAPRNKHTVAKFIEDKTGAVWTMTGEFGHSLKRWTPAGWITIDESWGLLKPGPGEMALAADGSLYILHGRKLYRLPSGGSRFEPAGPQGETWIASGLTTATDGNVWLSDGKWGTAPIDLTAASAPAPFKPTSQVIMRRIIFDQHGSIWGVAEGAGVFRIRDAISNTKATEESFTAADGLTSNTASAVLEDREGNIWVGTSAGLGQFRAANLVTERSISAHSSYGYYLFAARDGTVYVADSDRFYRIRPGGDPETVIDHLNNPESVCEDSTGSIWLITGTAMYRSVANEFIRVAPPAIQKDYFDCVGSTDGRVWLSVFGGGLTIRDGERWIVIPRKVVEEGASTVPMIAAPQGGVLGYRKSHGLYHVNLLQSELLWGADTIPGGDVTVLYQRGHDVLIGSQSGIARLRDNHMAALKRPYPWVQGISGIAVGTDGDVWIVARVGLVRLGAGELDRALDDPEYLLLPRIYDFRDGASGSPADGYAKNVSVFGGDGRLWFINSEGIVRLDPAHLIRNPLPPPVKIVGLQFDDIRIRDPQKMTLPAGRSRVEIDYAAPSLTIPQRVQVRYRLEGVDEDWIDAGSRRQSFYTNLTPGHYVFRVIAANNDGVWNNIGASLAFDIPPTFLQSKWFTALCAVLVCVLLWCAYLLRVRQLQARMRDSLEQRLAERERIARDLHDTLLQGFQGLILKFETVADSIPRDQSARLLIESALDSAEEVMVDGRDSVQHLRAARVTDLEQAFGELAGRLQRDHAATFELAVVGTPRALHAVVREEICRIGDEALINAFRHARATRIELAISYKKTAFILGIRDDGCGIEPAILDVGGRQGHFGLVGMRERAVQIQAEFSVSSRPRVGTEILVTVPGQIAFARAKQFGWRALLHRLLDRVR